QTGVSGGNGLYLYSSTSAFPTQTYDASNYYVDVVFSTAANQVPQIIAISDMVLDSPPASMLPTTGAATTTTPAGTGSSSTPSLTDQVGLTSPDQTAILPPTPRFRHRFSSRPIT